VHVEAVHLLLSEDKGMKREAVAATCRLLIRGSTRRRSEGEAVTMRLASSTRSAPGAGRGCGVDLGALLAVGDQQIEADAG
jgi:hypothetical protein